MKRKIRILNWHRYQPRHDRKNFYWFRFDHGFFNDKKISRLTTYQQMFFIYLLCDASLSNGEDIDLFIDHAARAVQTNEKAIEVALQKLIDMEMVADVTSDASVELNQRVSVNGVQDPLTEPSRDLNVVLQDTVQEDSKVETKPSKKAANELLPEFQKLHDVFRGKVSLNLQRSWLRIYPIEFIVAEMLKADAWIYANPHKSPRANFGAFFTRWLVRSWEDHRKTLPPASRAREQEIHPMFRDETKPEGGA